MEKREKILAAALYLFVEFGFHGTPTSKIAQKAGVANGTLFHYFATKEELIVALYSEVKMQMAAYVMQNSKLENSLKETMKGQYLATLYFSLDHKSEFKYMELFRLSPYISLISEEETEKNKKWIYDLLRKGITDKIIKPLPVDYLLTLMSSHTYGLNQYLILNEFPKAKQHQLINDTFELLWDMIT